MPERIQQRRTRGWRKPENTVGVSRPSRFGNPFVLGRTYPIVETTGVIVDFGARRYVHVHDAAKAVELHRQWITGKIAIPGGPHSPTRSDVLLLAGKNLMCFCPLPADGQPDYCHADTLIGLANGWIS